MLCVLYDASPRSVTMTDLAATAELMRGTCSDICNRLTERGLVDYDGTKRVGAAITEAGKALIDGEKSLTEPKPRLNER